MVLDGLHEMIPPPLARSLPPSLPPSLPCSPASVLHPACLWRPPSLPPPRPRSPPPPPRRSRFHHPPPSRRSPVGAQGREGGREGRREERVGDERICAKRKEREKKIQTLPLSLLPLPPSFPPPLAHPQPNLNDFRIIFQPLAVVERPHAHEEGREGGREGRREGTYPQYLLLDFFPHVLVVFVVGVEAEDVQHLGWREGGREGGREGKREVVE